MATEVVVPPATAPRSSPVEFDAGGAGKDGGTKGTFSIGIVVGVVIGIVVLIALAILVWWRARQSSESETDEMTGILYASLTYEDDRVPVLAALPRPSNEMTVEIGGGNHLNSPMSIEALASDNSDELL
jgi:hypothetical protein